MLGKISDPALDEPNNIYTPALNAGGVLHVTGKQTMKDGKLHKLFVTAPPDFEPIEHPVPVRA